MHQKVIFEKKTDGSVQLVRNTLLSTLLGRSPGIPARHTANLSAQLEACFKVIPSCIFGLPVQACSSAVESE
jgi:hypothetical protein